MSYAIDLSSHGRELKQTYDRVVSSDPESTWAIFTYKQASRTLEPTGEDSGSLQQFVQSFDDSRIEYGLASVDYNNITKIVLVGWVGEGVPDKVKTHFNAHFATVAKFFSGYHVQITARSSDDLSPAIILAKVDQAAGSKYSSSAKPTPSTRPKYVSQNEGANEDDWGDSKPIAVKDAPDLNPVSSAYKPTKVDLAATREAAKKSQEDAKAPSGNSSKLEGLDSSSSYKPQGKVDIAAIRAAGKDSKFADVRIEKIEPAYKPVGKVDIAAIRAAAKKQDDYKSSIKSETGTKAEPAPIKSSKGNGKTAADDEEDESTQEFGSVADRMKAFNSELRAAKPEPENKSSAISQKKSAFEKAARSETSPWASKSSSNSTSKATAPAAGFKDHGSQGGKTPAQQWAEKHGKFKSTPATGSDVADDAADEPDVDSEEHVGHVSDLKSKFAETSLDEDDEKPAGKSFSDITSKFAKSSNSSAPHAPTPAAAAAPSLPSRAEPASAPQEAAEEPGITAIVEEAYEKDSGDDEISLFVGETITNIDKVDEFWWLGTNSSGESGLFPAEYVRLVDSKSSSGSNGAKSTPAPTKTEPEPVPEPEKEPALPARSLPPPPPARPEPEVEEEVEAAAVAVAEFDYDGAEEDELTFKAGDKIQNIEFPSDDWWSGEINGTHGLFPANFVKLQ